MGACACVCGCVHACMHVLIILTTNARHRWRGRRTAYESTPASALHPSSLPPDRTSLAEKKSLHVAPRSPSKICPP